MTQILTHKPKGRRFDFRQATLGAAELRKVGTWRIGVEVMLLARTRGKLTANDYFLHGAWRPGLTWAERRQFVGMRANKALNKALNPPMTEALRKSTSDKLTATGLFEAAGLPMPETLAVAAGPDLGTSRHWLGSQAATVAFLREPGVLPCFGKPVFGSTGTGAVRLERLDDQGLLHLGDGRAVTPEALAAEIWAAHDRGFIFQKIVHPHPELERLIGPVIGTMRVVTIDAGRGPEALYVTLKAPAAGATVDGASGPLGCYIAVETTTGRVLRVQDRRRLGGTDSEVSPVTGVAIVAAVLPDFQAAVDLALKAHACVPEHGLLGIDVMLGQDGPVLVEANNSPFHSSYQTAFARGVLNPDLLPRLLAVRDRFRSVTPRPKDCPLK
jgi:hypothetical protein